MVIKMDRLNFLNNIIQIFNDFGINDLELFETESDLVLILPIDQEEDMPSYKIIVSFIDDDYLSLYAAFKHNAVLKDEIAKLAKICNNCNEETFLKFSFDAKWLKISYNIPEVEEACEERIVKILTIIPSLISDFYPDFKKYIE